MVNLRTSRTRLLAAGAVALLGIALALPSAGHASTRQDTIFDASGAVLSAKNTREQGRVLNELERLGVDQVRLVVPWRFLAPARGKSQPPAGFDASNPRDYPRALYISIDAAVEGIENRGMTTLLTPSGPAPAWATDANRGAGFTNPTPSDFGRFVSALGRRYSGNFRADPGKNCPASAPASCVEREPSPLLPRIRHWAFWNEGNQLIFLRPQYKNGRPYSPSLYRRLFLAGRSGLVSSGHGRDSILIGETAPSGGRTGVDPLPFMRGVLCLNSSFRRRAGCKPIQATGWSHHPYSPGISPFERSTNPGLVSLDNLGTLIQDLGRASRAGATSRRLPVYITEYGVQSVPDRRFGVGLRTQAGYLAISEFLAWSTPLVRSYAQYLLRDDRPDNPYRFTTGLELTSGKPKPSLRSFPITLLARRTGNRVLIWGHVRPGQGRVRVTVTYRQNGKARTLRRVSTNGRGYFRLGSAFRPGRTWAAKARVEGVGVLQGPYQPAYTF